ncbi:MAG: permease [Dehalococcoidia bacterium]
MDLSLLVMLLLVGSLYAFSYRQEKRKTWTALLKSIRMLIGVTPIFLAALAFASLLQTWISSEIVATYLGGRSGLWAIFIATMLGFIIPGPRYIIYPIAAFLLSSGASIGAVTAIICGQQMLDMPEAGFIEIKLFGFRFSMIRTAISVVAIFLAGLLAELLLS